jgi:hypothetical protein
MQHGRWICEMAFLLIEARVWGVFDFSRFISAIRGKTSMVFFLTGFKKACIFDVGY